MSKMNFEDKAIVCGFSLIVLLVLFLIGITINSSIRSNEYQRKCVEAGGVYLGSKSGDFCVKEFFPLKDGE